MILFKPEHVAPILRDEKTHTRRRGKRRWKVGAVHQARTNMAWQGEEGLFCYVRIKSVEPTSLFETTDEDAVLEGYPDAARYINAYMRINRIPTHGPKFDEAVKEDIWDVGFKRVVDYDPGMVR